MKPNFSKISHFFYQENERSQISVLRIDCIKDLGIHVKCKRRFHHHADFIFSHALKLLGLIRTMTFSFSTIDCPLMIYFALVRSKLEYAFVAWNYVTIT
jgi:hypothetical protein